MKKLTALILTAVMLVCMTAIVPVSAAADTIVITPVTETMVVEPGQTITLGWDINEDCDFLNVIFNIAYDKDNFTFKARSHRFFGNTLAADGYTSTVYNTTDPGYIYATHKSAYGLGFASILKEDGVPYPADPFYAVSFNVSSDIAPGDYEFVFTVSDGAYPTDSGNANLNVTPVKSVIVTVEGEEPPVVVVDGLKTVGGQVRVPHNGQLPEKFGFRFVSSMDSTVGGVEYGTLVIPTDLLEGELVVGNEKAADVVAAKVMSEEGGVVTFNATMVEIKDANLEREFTTRAYAKLADGSYVYGEAYKTTIFAVADELVNDATADQAHKDYVKSHVHGKLGK